MKASAAYSASRFASPEPPHRVGQELALRLTPRQLEVLSLLGEGLSNKLICRQLNISAGTVKAHVSCIFRELGVTSRLQAVIWARRHGLLTPGIGTAQLGIEAGAGRALASAAEAA